MLPVTSLIRQPWTGGLDRLAIGLSGLCLVHCIATAVALGLMSAAGGMLFSHLFHEIGLSLAILLGIVALGRGAVEHGYFIPAAVGAFGIGMMAGALALPHDGSETLWTVLGVGVLAFGHDLNYRATH
jgi:hypothetical protein